MGKGVTAASVALLLQSAGFRVNLVKIDMYLNQDAGTMNPLEHGEVFVTADGCETDQDLGHYERFLNRRLSRKNYLTAGQVYARILAQERALFYDGACVEVYHHFPAEVVKFLRRAGRGYDFLLVELGGSVGEYQNILFFETIRRWKMRCPNQVWLMHLVYLPLPPSLGEMKTKPAQQSIAELHRLGLNPDWLICRGPQAPDQPRRAKLALVSALPQEDIFAAPDTWPIYRLPLLLLDQGFLRRFLTKLGLPRRPARLKSWRQLIGQVDQLQTQRSIAIVGKYYASGQFSLADAYISVVESIKIAAWHQGIKPEIIWVDSEKVEQHGLSALPKKVAGVVVPGGFGCRGVEGKIATIRWARENKIPFLGLCYGLQLATVEFARHVAGLKRAHTTEVDRQTPHPVIDLMPEQEKKLLARDYGGTMRLGNWPCRLRPRTLARRAYRRALIYERHRHRYEVNNRYRARLEQAGLVIAGTSPDGRLVEIIELPASSHPFFVATQFHPEFTSRFLRPNPLFRAFISACQQNVNYNLT